MKITNLLKLLMAVLVIGGLSSCCQDINCTSGRLSVIGFVIPSGNLAIDTAKINSTIVRKFPLGSPYIRQNQLDSFVLRQYNTLSLTSNDTVNITIVGNPPFVLSPGYKYELYDPAVPADTLTIDSIMDTQTQLQACSGTEFSAKSCDNPLVLIYVNGAPILNTTSFQIIYYQ
jgi:hypothetical protein